MKTLRAKVLLTFTLIIIVSMSVSTMASMIISTIELSKIVNNNLLTEVQATALKIQNINNNEFKMLESFAKLPDIKDPEVDLKEKWESLGTISQGDSSYIGMAFYDEKGIGWTTTGKYQDLHERDYLKKSTKGVNAIMDPAYSPVNGKISTFYAVPVFAEDKKQIGVAVAVKDSMSLCESVKEMKFNDLCPVVISMGTGNIVASENLDDLRNAENISKIKDEGFQAIVANARAGKSSVETYKDVVTGKRQMVAYTPVGGDCDWVVIYSAPRKLFFGGLLTIVKSSTLYMGLGCGIGFIVMLILITTYLKPLKIFNKKMIENSDETANLDLTTDIPVKGSDEMSTIIGNYNKFNGNLRRVILGIKESKDNLHQMGVSLNLSVDETSESIKNILENIDKVTQQVEIQSGSVTDTAAAVNQIASSISALGGLIEAQSSGFSDASAAIEEMIANIEMVNHSVEKMAQEFENVLSRIKVSTDKQDEVNLLVMEVAKQSEMLNEANSVIASIASQTNLLAMNAAIEAAHAGDAGKGFSVVADEIRKLSENSTNQSNQIGNQLMKISDSIANVVTGSEETQHNLTICSDAIKETNELVIQIKNAMAEQTAGSRQVIKVLTEMNDNTDQVRNASANMQSGNDHILKEITNLQNATAGIKGSMKNMSQSTERIESTEQNLAQVSADVHTNINRIAKQIEKFLV
ncbi:MAG: methyl-accepting chemotaxis protein [Treponema sp.]|nr:methyl-accepting chemotaxis protein [Treponema sp.]